MDKKRQKVLVMLKRVMIAVTSVLLALYTSGLLSEGGALLEPAPGAAQGLVWEQVLDRYGIPFGQFCISSLYRMYLKLTVFNVLVFSTKYLPTGLYLYTFVKSVYRSSSERLKIKQMELEDIVLQIAIVETKQCVREAACAECAAALRRAAARLRGVRARVRDVIAADDSLRAVLERCAETRRDALDHQPVSDDPDLSTYIESKCIVELLKDLTHENCELAGRLNEIAECGGSQPVDTTSENTHSEYSSLNEPEVEKDCRIKIIKVTNVYKVAYLKHYIKQKRLRRASKQALLKKKMESIKKLLENWQKSLNLVINDKLSMLDGRDETSEEAMGDCSKPCDSDTDSELRASAGTCVDEYDAVWDQAQAYGYFQEPETSESREDFESHEYSDKYYGNYYDELEASVSREELEKHAAQCKCSALLPLPSLLEETSSQMLAVQDVPKPDHNNLGGHFVAM